MNDQPPPSKRQRIDPNAMDDDDILPPKGQSVLGKRKRKENNQFYYNQENAAIIKGAPANHPRNGNQFMNPEQKDDDDNFDINLNLNDDIPHSVPVTKFERGHQLDVRITNEHQDTFWTTGTICKIQEHKVTLSIYFKYQISKYLNIANSH